jgi:general stress protein 26
VNKRDSIKRWLKAHKHCVIATCVNNKPWAATVDYKVDKNLNILISTNPTSLKYKNIVKNSTVCIVVDRQDRKGTLQIQGTARIAKGRSFQGPNVIVKPTFLILKKKSQKTGKVTSIKLTV